MKYYIHLNPKKISFELPKKSQNSNKMILKWLPNSAAQKNVLNVNSS